MSIPFLKYVEWKLSKDQSAIGKSLLWSRQTILDMNYKTEHDNQLWPKEKRGEGGW